MKKFPGSTITALATACALPLLAHANAFERAAPHLDLDGDFITVVDFDGDGAELGQDLNLIYEHLLAARPDLPPIPIDFPLVFETMGFGSINTIGMSSKAFDDGLIRNRSIMVLDGEPAGLIKLYGTDPLSFRAAELAPADATGVISGAFKLTAVRDTIHTLLTQSMGTMGDDLAQSGLGRLVPGTDVAVDELIIKLSAPFDLVFKQVMLPGGQQEIEFFISVESAGNLLPRLRPMGNSMPITFSETSVGLIGDFSELLGDAPFGLYLVAPAENSNLLIYSSPEWAAATVHATERLTEHPAFAKLTSHLPTSAGIYSYSAGFDFKPILAMLGQNPEMEPYMPLIETVANTLLGDFFAPSANVIYRDGDVLYADQYAQFSYKQAISALPVLLSSSMAIPAFQNVRKTSQENAVRNNLRQIALAAQQKMLDEGVDEVNVADLVGPDNYILSLDSVAGESYDDIVVGVETTEISVVLPDGRTIGYVF